ncbi:MAG: aminotransferase class I/II-fold pyridoxal phosphate-dependent enzyme [Ruminococcaceae bacterium]|nr:aminotransferase class I/II-fold pyridoxal phosphate-dependent enzyme [Oscillospiraceae bacterium]
MAQRMESVHSDIRGPIYVEAMKMRQRGIDVLRLNTGNPATFGFTMPDSIKNALYEGAQNAVAYCDPKGMPAARAAICQYHRAKSVEGLTDDDVFIGNGVSELVPFAMQTVVYIGDEVLVPSPSYSLWTNSVFLSDATPVFYTCDESSNWYPDIEDIRRKITPKTKAIVIINPNNPTGALYPRELLQQIVELAEEHDLTIFSDEIYDRLIFDEKEHIATAALTTKQLVITMNGLSKSHIICGFRVGWMIASGPRTLVESFKEGVFKLCSMRLCSNALGQSVIPAALEDNASTREMILPGGRIYEQSKATVEELSKIDGVSVVPNSAAFYVFPKIDKKRFHVESDKEFALGLLRAKNVLIVPGSGFDWPHNDHFRIVMLPQPEVLRQAVRDMGDYLRSRE